jgi:hypothetical protein
MTGPGKRKSSRPWTQFLLLTLVPCLVGNAYKLNVPEEKPSL